MTGKGTPPYALFILANDTSTKVINITLQEACDGVDGVWDLYLTTEPYSDAPKKRDDGRVNDGTAAPVEAFPSPSPFAGKTMEQAADWLTAAPTDVDLDPRFFAVCDEYIMANHTLVISRIGDGGVEGKEGDVQYFPVKTSEAAMYLNSMTSNGFDERLQEYQRLQQRLQEPDLSQGEPYNGPRLGE
ncbi:hypothetical protein MMC15_003567 [Xylographa vitiligo]|nr:hypothetical protein [Xylographa vitiligo]